MLASEEHAAPDSSISIKIYELQHLMPHGSDPTIPDFPNEKRFN
ncbi:hypothetical protein [Pseudomonas sp.]|nr:hypothetical protein [Pseudomonas sp.]